MRHAAPVPRPEFPPAPDALQLWRRALGLSQGQVARFVRMSQSWVSFIESPDFGWTRPHGLDHFERHCAAVEAAYDASVEDATAAAALYQRVRDGESVAASQFARLGKARS